MRCISSATSEENARFRNDLLHALARSLGTAEEEKKPLALGLARDQGSRVHQPLQGLTRREAKIDICTTLSIMGWT
jgi:hypothetical protein